MKKFLLGLFIGISFVATTAYGLSVLTPSQGGTGIGTVTAGNIGNCLKVLTNSPFAYELGSCGGGGSGGGSWSTTTSQTSGRLINYPNNNTDIVVIGSNSTTTGKYWFDPNTLNALIGNTDTASTTIMGGINFPTLSQGLLYTGSSGKVNSIASSSLNVGTATALTANGTNCSAGSYPLGVDASGNSENCTVATTGTVTSVGLSDSNSTLTIGSTPVTTSGTITATLNLGHTNTWTILQNFNYSSSTIYSSFLTASSTFLNAGSFTLATTSAGCASITSAGLLFSTGVACASGGSFTNTIANGGTGSTSFAPNSIITSNAAGTALIATTSNLYVTSLFATSTTATSTFNGNVLISPNNDTTYGFNSWQPFEIVGSSNNPFQMDIVNRSTGAQALSSIFLGNDKTTNGGFTSSYYGGMTCAGSNYNTPGANAVRPNGCASFASDGPYSLGSAATNAASSTIFFQSGSGLDVSYDAALMGGLGNFVLGTTTLRTVNGIASYALSTAYNNAKLWISSSTIPQIALEGGDADNIWNMRSIGNQFFLATSSPTTYATSSRSAFSLDANGFPAFSALAGVGCAQFDATGKFSNTGSACGSGGGGGGVGWASSTADTNSIYSYGTGGVFVRGNSSAATSSRALLEVNAPGGIMPFYVGSSTSLFEVDGASNGFVSVGSTTPWGKFSVNPNALGSGVPELVVGSSSATRFLINGAGNIGIGTTTPTNPLTIFSSTGGQISLSAGTGVSQAVMRYDGSNFTISSTTVAGTATSTPAAFTLNTAGVGFFSGTTTNSAATGFAINGTGYLSGLSSSASTQTGSLCLSSTNEVINDSGVCIVSDLRAKNVKGLFTDALSEIAKIKPISYFYKPEFNGELQKNPNYSAEQLGLGAQDLQKVDPRLVEVYTKDGKNNVFSYKQGEASAPKIPALVALALGGVKELNQKVENINLGKVTRSAQDNWQWAVIVLLALWIVRLEVKLKKRD